MQRVRHAWHAFALLLALAALSAPARSQSETSVEIHGFVSQGFIKSTENDYLGPSERGSFEFTEAAVNFTHSPLDNLRIGVQLFARDIGPFGNYDPRFDWYYLDYRFFDGLGVRAGRTKLPFGLYNEVNDIDAARVPILLPQSLYPVSRRESLFAQTGVELYGELDLGGAGNLSYQLYGGTIYLDPDDVDVELRDGADIPYVVGGRLMWLSPVEGLSLGGSLQAFRVDFEAVLSEAEIAAYNQQMLLPPDFDGILTARLPALLGVASLQYERGELLLAAEYTQTHAKLHSDLAIPTVSAVDHGFYVLGAYRIAPWLTPGAYYSSYLPDPTDRVGPEKYQHDVALTLRFDINAHWLFKFESHYMRGTAALAADENGGTPLRDLPSSWGLFLLKTTAYF